MDRERGPQVEVVGTALGSEADADEFLGDLTARAGTEPARAWRRQLTYREAKRRLDQIGSLDDQGEQAGRRSAGPAGPPLHKSEFFRQPLPRDTITELVDNLSQGVTTGHTCEVTFLPWGGAYNRVRVDATAFPHREELFLIQHLLDVLPTPPRANATRAVAGSRDRGRSCTRGDRGGVYPNFPDPTISKTGRSATTERTTPASYA